MADSVYLDKAKVALAGAESEYRAGRYLNVANRAYYACFQAAIAALIAEGIRPESRREIWEHDFVQSRFSGQLVNRRKIYSADLRDALQQNQKLRNLADYAIRWPTDVQALRSLERTRRLVAEGEQRISR